MHCLSRKLIQCLLDYFILLLTFGIQLQCAMQRNKLYCQPPDSHKYPPQKAFMQEKHFQTNKKGFLVVEADTDEIISMIEAYSKLNQSVQNINLVIVI